MYLQASHAISFPLRSLVWKCDWLVVHVNWIKSTCRSILSGCMGEETFTQMSDTSCDYFSTYLSCHHLLSLLDHKCKIWWACASDWVTCKSRNCLPKIFGASCAFLSMYLHAMAISFPLKPQVWKVKGLWAVVCLWKKNCVCTKMAGNVFSFRVHFTLCLIWFQPL